VGVYLPIQTSLPIFLGGALRWLVDKVKRQPGAESDMSPGVLLSSGYIAGGAIGGVLVALFGFAPGIEKAISLRDRLPAWWNNSNWPSIGTFSVLILLLALTGFGLLFRSGQLPPAKSSKSR